jgi:hypothetical protein
MQSSLSANSAGAVDIALTASISNFQLALNGSVKAAFIQGDSSQ